jgi:deoxyadenosine/deoxycytidine kinase
MLISSNTEVDVPSPSRPWFLAICGLMGSGKTTLARGLARLFDWTYVPEFLPATVYLPDQFLDTRRWAFETQTAFLVHKAISIQEVLRRGDNAVLDRSLHEDVKIFARYFHEHGDIDERSYGTYLALASHLLETIPSPQIAILCECPLDEIRQRIAFRARDFQRLYPSDHLEKLYGSYKEWSDNYYDSDLYVLDTLAFDTRDPRVLSGVADEIVSLIRSKVSSSAQLGLFDLSPEDFQPAILKPLHRGGAYDAEPIRRQLFRLTGVRKFTTSYPSAYIGAPFTAQISRVHSPSDTLFDLESPHGLLGQGPFRALLTSIEGALRKMGVHPFLPHRQINRWGKRRVPPDEVAALCSDYVRECDIFIGIPGLSNGTHYELGLAIGLGKPTIIIHCEEIPRSYLSDGFRTMSDRLLVIRCGEMRQVYGLVLSNSVREFIGRHVPVSLHNEGRRS